TYHGDDRPVHDGGSQGGVNLILGDGILVFEEFFHQPLIVFGHGLDQCSPEFLYLIHHIGGNVDHIKSGSKIFVMPDDGPVLHQIDDALEIGLVPNGKYDRHRIGTQHFTDLLADVQEICALTVHFVHKSDSWDLIVVGQPPVGLGLGLHPIHRTEEKDQT